MRTRTIAHAGVIAAVYAALTLFVIQTPLGYGPIQLRISEALTVLACLTGAAVPGLWMGAVVANAFMLSQFGVLGLFDVVLGGAATLLGAWWTWHHRERVAVALAGPVVANALIVPAYLPLMLGGAAGVDFYSIQALGIDASAAWWSMYLFGVVTVGLGEAAVVYLIGLPLLLLLKASGVGRLLESGRPEVSS